MTLAPGPATRLTVYLKANARWHHKPVSSEIVERAHRAGLAGASVFRGDEGFGKSAHIHTTRLLSLNGDLPCAVVIVDVDERIRAFLPQIEEILEDGVVFLEAVEVIGYDGGGGEARWS
jgi:PII-like signaling protein